MARKTLQQRLAEIELKKKRLEARIDKIERKQDTRRKVLLGALLLQRLEGADEAQAKRLRDWLKRELPAFLMRDTDRDLLADLMDQPTTPPAPGTKTETTATAPVAPIKSAA